MNDITRESHDDIIKWKHFLRYWPFVQGIHQSPVNSPHKGQWRGALMFPLICTRINSWVNNGEAGDLRRNRAHYHLKSPASQLFTQSLYPPHNEVVGGVYWFHSVRPSVCPSVRLSVRPSVPHAVSALYHLQLWMDSFHIRHKWSLPWEGVSRTMTFDLDLYLQGRSALT